jgi:ribosome-binding protein aMBF1 (putative translation factor)
MNAYIVPKSHLIFLLWYLATMIKVYNEAFIIAFGKHLKKLREHKDLSQRDLADVAKIKFSQIGRIERGEQNTSISTLYALAKALEIPPTKLLAFDFKEK